MVDIVLTPEQLSAIRKSAGPVRFVTPSKELVCVTDALEPSRVSEFEASTDCEPLSVEQIEELARRISAGNSDAITTDELLKRLDERRAS
jgi:hypothetical protein